MTSGGPYENWRNPELLNAERPTFKRKNRTGTGAFLAASGVDRVKYDDHRRIRLPYLGSVKLKRELPEGIPYEVRIKQENGRWYASVNYWKPPVGAEEKTHLCGAVDVGITPLAVDSELVHYENPKALYRMLAKLQRWQRTLARAHGVPWAPEAGMKRKGASTPFTAASTGCGTTRTTRSAASWSGSTPCWPSRA